MTDTQSIYMEPGESLVLSPKSERFKESYSMVQPRTADEVREIMGLSAETAKALQEQGVCCQQSAKSSAIVPAEELDSPDYAIRARAWTITQKALYNYVYSVNPVSLFHMKPAIERYLDINKAVLHIVKLEDIVVSEGGILEIKDTQLVHVVNKIFIPKTGRIICNGYLKFKANSIDGT